MKKAPNEEAWKALYDAHFDALYRVVSRLGVEGAAREDLVQRAFELAFVRVSEGLPMEDVGRWLRGTIGNLVRSHRRWRNVRRLHQGALEALFGMREGPPSPQASVASSQTRDHIERTVARMSPKLRDVLVLIDVEDLSADEVAAVLDIPENTVRSRLRLAREQFRGLWGSASERVGAIA